MFENSSQQYKHAVAFSEVNLVDMCLIGLVDFNLLPACPLLLSHGSSLADLLLVFVFCSNSLSYGLSVIIQVFPPLWGWATQS